MRLRRLPAGVLIAVCSLFMLTWAGCPNDVDDDGVTVTAPAETPASTGTPTATGTTTQTTTEAAAATENGTGGGIVSAKGEADAERTGYLSVSVAQETAARTALPALGANDFENFLVRGSTDGGFTWETVGEAAGYADAGALTSAQIPVCEGWWLFMLEASRGGATYRGYSGRVEIVARQESALSFTLTLSALAQSGTGGIKISAEYPANGVRLVEAGLYKTLGSADAVCAPEPIDIHDGADATRTAIYEKDGIPAGMYVAEFRFYGDEAKTLLLGAWREYAAVTGGVTSASTGNSIASLEETYAITYDYGGGELASGVTAAATYTRHASVTLPAAGEVARTGYTFAGWYESADFSGSAAAEIPEGSTGAKSFYTKWTANTYTVRFHKNTGATDTATATQLLTYDATEAISTLASLGFARTDAIFLGWGTAADGTGLAWTANETKVLVDGTSAAHNLCATQGGTVDLYAVWQYVVTFAGNKGSAHSTDVTGTTDPMTVTGYATTHTMRANGFAHTGYTFQNWNTRADGTGTPYTAGTAYSFSANVTLYAQWKANKYTVYFYKNLSESDTAFTTQTLTFDKEESLTTLSSLGYTRTDATFVGWGTSRTATAVAQNPKGNPLTDGQTAAHNLSSGDRVNLYAIWKFTIRYNSNKGSASTTLGGAGNGNQTVTGYATNLKVSENGFELPGYTFQKWNTASDGSGTDYTAGSDYTFSADTMLYAKWKANLYTITLDRNGGTGGSEKVIAVFDAVTEGIVKPTRTGYTFAGYYDTDATTGGTRYYTENGTNDGAKTYTLLGDITLYARWNLDTYSITYELDGGTNASGAKTSYTVTDAADTLPTRATRRSTPSGNCQPQTTR